MVAIKKFVWCTWSRSHTIMENASCLRLYESGRVGVGLCWATRPKCYEFGFYIRVGLEFILKLDSTRLVRSSNDAYLPGSNWPIHPFCIICKLEVYKILNEKVRNSEKTWPELWIVLVKVSELQDFELRNFERIR